MNLRMPPLLIRAPTPARISRPAHTEVQISSPPEGLRIFRPPPPAPKQRSIALCQTLCCGLFAFVPLSVAIWAVSYFSSNDAGSESNWIVYLVLGLFLLIAVVLYVGIMRGRLASEALVLTPEEVVLERDWMGWKTRQRVKRHEVTHVDITHRKRNEANWSACEVVVSGEPDDDPRVMQFGGTLTLHEKQWVLLEVAHYLGVPVGAGLDSRPTWTTLPPAPLLPGQRFHIV